MFLARRSLGAPKHLLLAAPAFSSTTLSYIHRDISTHAMSRRPNFQGGRRGGGGVPGRGGDRGRGRGGRVGGRGEQRWWDPVWRAERLRQKQSEMEVLDEDEWWSKMEQMKLRGEQEIIMKRSFSRDDQEKLYDMAFELGLHFHAYNKGKTLVISKVPLPDYRADLDEQHGSTQKEIQMPTEIERRVGNLLNSSQKAAAGNESNATSSQGGKHASLVGKIVKPASMLETDAAKEKQSIELKQKQDKLKASSSVKEMQSFREKLPAFKMRTEFLKAVAENQVLVISGETGCGKTTQLPQYILEEGISSLRGAHYNIVCTQPRRISAISVAARIASERGESLGETVGYQIRLEALRSAQTRLLFCTTGVLLRQLVQDPDLTGVSHLLVDEIHERGMNEDFLLIILHDLLPRRPDMRLILMSATINADLFSKYFRNAPTIHIPGLTFPVSEFYLEDVLEKTRYEIQELDSFQGNSRQRRREQYSKKDPITELFEEVDIGSQYKNYSASTRLSLEAWSGSQLDLGLVEATIEYICRHEREGAVLVFLTGWDEISKLLEQIKGNKLLGDQSKFLVLPLHGSMPTINQREIFDRPPPNKRKIVLATNIAESSITIDDVVYVVDCGKAKETSYDALNKLACLLPSWVSKASAHQRRGRAGRLQPGVCYRLYPKIIHDSMLQYQLPEILRTPLQELCLHIKSLQLGAVGSFLSKALQPPDPLAVENAIELLKTIGALDDKEELTPLGRHLCTLPVDPNIGKLLLMGCVFQCLSPALTIAAALAHRDPFVLPIDRKREADAAKRSFAGDSCSDHIALVKAFEGYKEAKRNRNERAFCWEYFLSPVTLRMMEDMRDQFLNLLSDIGFVDKSRGAIAYNQYSQDMEMVSAILCAGLYPNVVQCKRRGKRTAFFTKEVGKVDIHPASVNAGIHLFPLPYMVYSERVKTTSIYVRDSTNISDYALLLFGGNLVASKSGEGIEMLRGYLHFSASKSVLDLIQKLRGELDKLWIRALEIKYSLSPLPYCTSRLLLYSLGATSCLLSLLAAMKDSLGTSQPCPSLKSLTSKLGGMFHRCGSPNKYKRLDAKLEKKLIELKRSSSGKTNFKSMNSIIMRFPQFKEELKHIRGVFEQYDEDANGNIDMEELKKCLQNLQLNLKEEEVEDLFHSCDIDQSEGIQFNEFIVLLCLIYLLVEHSSSPLRTSKMGSPELEATFDTIVKAFLFLDKNGAGKLNKKDMIKALNEDSPWEKSPAHITRSRFKEMDWDRNGKVSFREFLFSLINWIGIDADEEIPVSTRT